MIIVKPSCVIKLNIKYYFQTEVIYTRMYNKTNRQKGVYTIFPVLKNKKRESPKCVFYRTLKIYILVLELYAHILLKLIYDSHEDLAGPVF